MTKIGEHDIEKFSKAYFGVSVMVSVCLIVETNTNMIYLPNYIDKKGVDSEIRGFEKLND